MKIKSFLSYTSVMRMTDKIASMIMATKSVKLYAYK